MNQTYEVIHRTRRVRVAGRLLFGLGDSTCEGTIGPPFLEAARVLREAGAAAGAAGCVDGADLVVAAFARFLGTLSSSFSLSPSSEGRFFPRVVFDTALGAAFAGAAFVLRAAG